MFPDETGTDVGQADPSPAQQTDPQAQPNPQPGGAQPTDPNGAQSRNFDKHPRFQQLIRENRESRSQIGQMQQQLQQAQQQLQALQRTAQGPAYTQEQRQARVEAIRELKALMQEDPDLAEVLRMRQQMPQLMQGYQGVQQLNQTQREATVRGGRQEIASLVEKAGLPVDSEGAFERYEDAITGIISRDPELTQRFRSGDSSVIGEAFQQLQSFLGLLQRPAQAGLLQTKQRTRQLPPAPRGGTPSGQEAPLKLEPGKEREYEQSLHQRAMGKLNQLLTG